MVRKIYIAHQKVIYKQHIDSVDRHGLEMLTNMCGNSGYTSKVDEPP
jgi:hypothetical protein